MEAKELLQEESRWKGQDKGQKATDAKGLGSLPDRLVALFHSSMTQEIPRFLQQHCHLFPVDASKEQPAECMVCFNKFELLLEELMRPIYEERGLAVLFEQVQAITTTDSHMQRIIEMILAASNYLAFAVLMRNTRLTAMGAAVPLPSSDEDDWADEKL
jgi:hypothetical protein